MALLAITGPQPLAPYSRGSPRVSSGPSSILFPSLSSLNVLEQKGVSSACVPKLHTSPLQVTDV